jgi:hypothetical protein
MASRRAVLLLAIGLTSSAVALASTAVENRIPAQRDRRRAALVDR